MKLPSKLMLSLTTATVVSAMLTGCADERGFKAKAFPKAMVLTDVQGDPSGPQDSAQSPAAKTPQEQTKVNEFVSTELQRYKETLKAGSKSNDKMEEVINNLTPSDVAGRVVKGLSIIHTGDDTVEVRAILNLNGARRRLISTGTMKADSQDFVALANTFAGEDGIAQGVETYAYVGQDGGQKVIRILMKITKSDGKVVYAIFGESTADQKHVSSSINTPFRSFDEADGIVQEKRAEKPQQEVPPVPAAADAVVPSSTIETQRPAQVVPQHGLYLGQQKQFNDLLAKQQAAHDAAAKNANMPSVAQVKTRDQADKSAIESALSKSTIKFSEHHEPGFAKEARLNSPVEVKTREQADASAMAKTLNTSAVKVTALDSQKPAAKAGSVVQLKTSEQSNNTVFANVANAQPATQTADASPKKDDAGIGREEVLDGPSGMPLDKKFNWSVQGVLDMLKSKPTQTAEVK
jgi:hypothetical protein